jgi:hypothetical protein
VPFGPGIHDLSVQCRWFLVPQLSGPVIFVDLSQPFYIELVLHFFYHYCLRMFIKKGYRDMSLGHDVVSSLLLNLYLLLFPIPVINIVI